MDESRPKPNAEPASMHSRSGGRTWWVVAALLLLVAVAIGAILRARLQPNLGYITAPVLRKDLVQTVTATGTVNPQNTILVGSQVSGTISELDADYNSVVKHGQVLTRIDPTLLQAELDQAKAAEIESQSAATAGAASATSAEQNVLSAEQSTAAAREAFASAESQVGKTKAALALANLTLRRDRSLLAQGFIPQSQADTDSSSAVAAQAAYAAATIAVRQAKAELDAQIATTSASAAQARSAEATALANRNTIEVEHSLTAAALYNYGHSIITSPVNGTVIARNISIGQTVASSFQTPTLYTIAQDLSKMEVDVAVGEPDIGGVRAGDITDFTVLAYPNRIFHGSVYQVRQNPTTLNNVVTYDTVVYVANRDGALYPGMTANATIHVTKVQHALVVPIAALQWAPPKGHGNRPSRRGGTPLSPWGTTEASLTRTIIAGRPGRLFVMRNGQPTHVPVRILLIESTQAAVAPLPPATLAAGDAVVIADTSSQLATQQPVANSALTRNPQSPLGRSGGGAR